MPYDGARGDVLDPLAVWGFGPLKGGPSASLGIEPRRCAQQRSLSDRITGTVFERGDRSYAPARAVRGKSALPEGEPKADRETGREARKAQDVAWQLHGVTMSPRYHRTQA